MYSYAAYPHDYEVNLQPQDGSPIVEPEYSAIPSQDLVSNFTQSFSRGSPYVYSPQSYVHYIVDRGELDSRLCSTSLVSSTLDATGVGFSGDHSTVSFTAQVIGPEDISAYGHQSQWDSWPTSSNADLSEPSTSSSSGIIAPAPIYATPSSFSGTPFNHGGASCHLPLEKDPCASGSQDTSSACSLNSTVAAPVPPGVSAAATQLPTPAALAVLLNPNSRSAGASQQASQLNLGALPPFDLAPGVGSTSDIITPHRASPSVGRASRPGEPGSAVQGVPEAQSREKKHACTMCHKRFDRPSTLRKHLLVHTGEKAYVCDTCGRRFGVASNLNRHVKRCQLKPVNSNSSPSASKSATDQVDPTSSSSPSSTSPTTTLPLAMPSKNSKNTSNSSSGQAKRGRQITPPTGASPSGSNQSPDSATNNTSTNNNNDNNKSPTQKRRRRAPSPSSWVPATLRNFNLASEAFCPPTPVPLPPVRRNLPKEERDSWDENVAATPYHPSGWKGILPGPGLGHHHGLSVKNVQNFNLGGRGGFMLGRVMRVF